MLLGLLIQKPYFSLFVQITSKSRKFTLNLPIFNVRFIIFRIFAKKKRRNVGKIVFGNKILQLLIRLNWKYEVSYKITIISKLQYSYLAKNICFGFCKNRCHKTQGQTRRYAPTILVFFAKLYSFKIMITK